MKEIFFSNPWFHISVPSQQPTVPPSPLPQLKQHYPISNANPTHHQNPSKHSTTSELLNTKTRLYCNDQKLSNFSQTFIIYPTFEQPQNHDTTTIHDPSNLQWKATNCQTLKFSWREFAWRIQNQFQNPQFSWPSQLLVNQCHHERERIGFLAVFI